MENLRKKNQTKSWKKKNPFRQTKNTGKPLQQTTTRRR
jgi:hypothetical protein